MRVLLAETQDDGRRVHKALLEARGHEVIEAANVAEAERCLSGPDAGPFDVVLADVGLRGGGCEALVRRVRARLGSPPPCIALTVYEFASEDARLAAAGFVTAVRRNAQPQAFVARVEDARRPAA